MARLRTQLSRALFYAEQMRWPVIPVFEIANGCCACARGEECSRAGKHPRTKHGVHNATTDPDQIRAWWEKWPNANIGVATGRKSGIIVIDADPRNGSRETGKILLKQLGPLPRSNKSRSGGGGKHYVLRNPEFTVHSDSKGKLLGPGLDVMSDGSYFIAPQSTHYSGKEYRWVKGQNPSELEPAVLPGAWLERLRPRPESQVRKVRGDGANPAPEKPKARADGSTEVAEGRRNNHLTSVAGKLWRAGISADALLAALQAENTSHCTPPLEIGEVEKIAASVMKYAPGVSAANRSDTAEALVSLVLDRWFAGGKHLMFAPDGQFWEFDVRQWRHVSDDWMKGKILDAVQTGTVASTQNTASLLAQTFTLLKAKLATKEDRLAFVAEPPPIINCANGELWIAQDGSVDLRPHRPESFLRHCLDVNYDPNAKCPRYDKAIRGIFDAAEEPASMVRHWNELMGYIIQPGRSIPIILLLLGKGDNGKTSLVFTITQLLGRHLVCAQSIATFDKNRFAMGSLFGKHLYIDDDVPAGIKLPDGFLKTISEAKLVTGEAKYRDPFNFIVRTVPVLLCNNVPSVADLSHGMLRRLMAIPFDRTFTAEDKDETLFKEIWAEELSGVLNCALRGLQRLIRRRYRFALPSDVRDATERFIRDANPLPAFIASSCKIGLDERCLMRDFYKAYSTWADENGITLKQMQSTVRRNLEHMGYAVPHRNRGDMIFGLSLRPAAAY